MDLPLCYMELREGDVAENQNIRSSRRAAEYSLTFEMILPGGQVQYYFSNSPAGRVSAIEKPAKADRSGKRTRPDEAAVYFDFWPSPSQTMELAIGSIM